MITTIWIALCTFIAGVIVTALVMGLFARLGDPARLQTELVEVTRDKEALLLALDEMGQFIKADPLRAGGVLVRIAELRRIAQAIEAVSPELLHGPHQVLAALLRTDEYLRDLEEHWFRKNPEHTEARLSIDLRFSPFVYSAIASATASSCRNRARKADDQACAAPTCTSLTSGSCSSRSKRSASLYPQLNKGTYPWHAA